MKLIVVSDAHIFKDDNTGSYYCNTAVSGYEFWKRYLNVFDEVRVVARVFHKTHIDETKYIKADGAGVKYIELPGIRGMKTYIFNLFKLKKILHTLITDEDCGIFRLPSFPTFLLMDEFKKKKRPYAIEVIADPEFAYSQHFFVKKIMAYKLKKECKLANGVSYVTQFYLQEKYPCLSLENKADNQHFDSYYSSINLEKDFYSNSRVFQSFENRTFKLVHVCASMNSDLKGHTTLLKVVKELVDNNYDVQLECIGDGDKRRYYEDMAKQFGIDEKVSFLGWLSDKKEIREHLLSNDLMLFPTQAEGLPRVLIESMAVGLPCLSTPVNGIPELLDSKYMFDPYDVSGFTNKIISLINNPEELSLMSEANLDKARQYSNDILQARRDVFYTKLLKCCSLKEFIVENR